MGDKTNHDPLDAMKALEDFTAEEAARREKREILESKKEKKKNVWIIGEWTVLLLCIGIIFYQAPSLIAEATKKEKPIRIGTYATDDQTDECIRRLWEIAARLQRGEEPDGSIVCPASKNPFEVSAIGEDLIVSSPQPQLYGFKEIRVSRKKPVPELIR